eukprot:RCo008363
MAVARLSATLSDFRLKEERGSPAKKHDDRSWDARHHLGGIPAYDACEDKFCKWPGLKKCATLTKTVDPVVAYAATISALTIPPLAATAEGKRRQLQPLGAAPPRPKLESLPKARPVTPTDPRPGSRQRPV